MIYLLVYLITDFVTFSLFYNVLFDIKLTKKPRNWIAAIVILIGVHTALFFWVGHDGAEALSAVTMIVIPIFLLRPMGAKNFLVYPFIFMASSSMNVGVSFIVARLLRESEYKLISETENVVLCQLLLNILLLAFYRYKKVKRIQDVVIEPDWKQYLVFYLVGISIFFMLGSIQALSYGDFLLQYINYIGFACSVACIVLIGITLWQGIVVNKANKIKLQNQMNEKYLEQQKEYYQRLIEQDAKLRRFRHDMNGHIVAMKAYCEEENVQELKNYLERFVDSSSLYSVRQYTGHKGIDAILNQFMEQAERLTVSVRIEGSLSADSRVADFDLCAIMDNLLRNAIEACARIAAKEKRKIRIRFGSYNRLTYICVVNTVAEEITICDRQMLTSKSDPKNHGMGNKIIRAIVEKYEGDIEYRCEGGLFQAELFL